MRSKKFALKNTARPPSRTDYKMSPTSQPRHEKNVRREADSNPHSSRTKCMRLTPQPTELSDHIILIHSNSTFIYLIYYILSYYTCIRPLKAFLSVKHSLGVGISAKMKESTILDQNWISPRKLIPAQTKVYPRAVFTPLGSLLQPSLRSRLQGRPSGGKDRPWKHFSLSRNQLPR